MQNIDLGNDNTSKDLSDSVKVSSAKSLQTNDNAELAIGDELNLTQDFILADSTIKINLQDNAEYQAVIKQRDNASKDLNETLTIQSQTTTNDNATLAMQDSMPQMQTIKGGGLDTETANNPNESIEIEIDKGDNNATLPRVKNVTNEAQAVEYFSNEVRRRFRLNQYETMIENIQPSEVEDAIYDTLEEINQTPPLTNLELLHFVKKGVRYRRVFILGVAKNILLTLTSIWSANGMDVAIEDLSADNKLSDIQSLYETLNEQFVESLTQLKEYDRILTRSFKYTTGRYRFGNQSVGQRLSRIITNGGFLGGGFKR